MATQLKLRRGTYSEWASENPTLAEGEPGFESDTGRIKVGDGETIWSSLNYLDEETDLSDYLTISSASATYAKSSNQTFSGLIVLPSTTSIGDVDGTEIQQLNNASANIQNQINLKANANNAVLTGTTEIYSPKNIHSFVTKSASVSNLELSDFGKIVKVNTSVATSIVVPKNLDENFPIGAEITIYQYGSGQITFTPDSLVVINSPNGYKTRARYSAATLIKIDTDEWLLMGDVIT